MHVRIMIIYRRLSQHRYFSSDKIIYDTAQGPEALEFRKSFRQVHHCTSTAGRSGLLRRDSRDAHLLTPAYLKLDHI